MAKEVIEVVGFGGGHGQGAAAAGISMVPGVVGTFVCPNTDFGGGTKDCRVSSTQNGYQDPGGFIGDAGECVVSIMGEKETAYRLRHRYERGPFSGQTPKNLILYGLIDAFQDPDRAIKEFSRIFEIAPQRVLPVSDEPAHLCARLADGSTVIGEGNVDNLPKERFFDPEKNKITEVWLKPNIRVSRKVEEAIERARVLVIFPGSWYGNVRSIFAVDGMSEVVSRSAAKIILMLNLVAQTGDTSGYRAKDLVKQAEKCLKRRIDEIWMNNNTNLPILELAQERLSLGRTVKPSFIKPLKDERVILAPFLMEVGDLIRHNPEVVREVFAEFIATRL